MNERDKKTFHEQLLSQETNDPRFQQTFHQEVKKMYIEKLKKSQRWSYVLAGGLVSLLMLLFWGLSKMFEGFQLELDAPYLEPLRLTSTWAMLLSAALVLLSLWPAIRGKVSLRFYPKVMRFVFWMLILMVVALFFAAFDVIEENTQLYVSTEISWIFTMVVLVIVMGVYLLLSGRIDRGDIQNKTKMLELEYKLAALEEKLNQPGSQRPTGE